MPATMRRKVKNAELSMNCLDPSAPGPWVAAALRRRFSVAGMITQKGESGVSGVGGVGGAGRFQARCSRTYAFPPFAKGAKRMGNGGRAVSEICVDKNS